MMSEQVSFEQDTRHLVPLDLITSRLPVRRTNTAGVQRLMASLRASGFLPDFPLLVAPLPGGTFQLLHGNHRYEAARALKLAAVPCLVATPRTEADAYTLAWRSHAAEHTAMPATLVTYAEFIWARLAETDARDKPRYTQQEVARMLGWKSDSTVSNYALLAKVTPAAWDIITSTTTEPSGFSGQEEVVDDHSATVDASSPALFTERLLRCILPLSAEQQLDLVHRLATSRDFSKSKFKTLAEHYRRRNEMHAFACTHLGDLGGDSHARLTEAVYSGAYDADWEQPEHPKLQKLLTALREEWEHKHSVHLIQGDFATEAPRLGDGCIDLILTDQPYLISRENTFVLENHTPRSQDFGSWDHLSEEAYLAAFAQWTKEWARLLRPQGSGYVFVADRFLSHLRQILLAADLHVKATIAWHKTNPAPQVVHTNFCSSIEYLLFFTRGEGGHTFNWQGDDAMHNHIETPICGGQERLVDGRGNTLHPTQKPESLLRHFIEVSSTRGETVLAKSLVSSFA